MLWNAAVVLVIIIAFGSALFALATDGAAHRSPSIATVVTMPRTGPCMECPRRTQSAIARDVGCSRGTPRSAVRCARKWRAANREKPRESTRKRRVLRRQSR
jgi:hypothetical protein